MSIAIEKLVALVIFVIILLVIIIFIGIPEALGKDVATQNDLRNCCRVYVALGCPEFSDPGTDLQYINCGSDRTLGELASQFSMNYDSLISFCNCP